MTQEIFDTYDPELQSELNAYLAEQGLATYIEGLGMDDERETRSGEAKSGSGK